MSDDESKDCQGVYFRCSVNPFVTGDSIQNRVKFKLLKRKSCDGKCQKLDKITAYFTRGWEHRCAAWSTLKAIQEEEGGWPFDGTFSLPEDPKNDGLYRIECCVQTDIETGYIEDIWFRLVFIEES